MKYPNILVTGAPGKTEHPVADQHFATATAKTHEIASARAWFAGGDRVGYDSNLRSIVQAQGAPLIATRLLEDRVTSSDCGWMSERRSFCKNRQVQLPKPLSVGQYINLDNSCHSGR